MRKDDPHEVSGILRALDSESPGLAWEAFLTQYSPIVLQVVRLFETEQDQVADCFVFVCTELSRNGFRRLLQFQPEGAASFATWLRVVVRRLCIDRHRKEFGRARIFKSVEQLGRLDRAVFTAAFVKGFPADGALEHVRGGFPQLTRADFDDSCERIRQALTPRQLWLMAARRPRLESADALLADESSPPKRPVARPVSGSRSAYR